MRKAVKKKVTIAVAAAAMAVTAMTMTVVATVSRQHATAAVYADPLPPGPFVDLPQLTSYGYWPQLTPYGDVLQFTAYEPVDPTTSNWPSFESKSNLGLFPTTSLGGLKPFSEPQQSASTADPHQSALATEPRQNASKTEPHQSASTDNSKRLASYESQRQMQVPIVRIEFNAPALAPMAYTFFCLKYQSDCRVHKTVFRGGAIKLTTERWTELKRINTDVNHAIVPKRNNGGLAAENWLISPKAGDCHDYAVTKRHELMAQGWPARSLLLSEVETSWGEHHLVLVVRTNEGDFVADNLNGNIRNWSKTPYHWVRIQSPANPTFWSTVASKTIWAKAGRLTSAES